ncbi:MAG TPA: alcohol dehydrogenase catalytic domain-containing protein [Acidimicrobiales bacterium]|nr:alcohol dehydrogenase catalytic domain-containing protein [Acidimicrobiales bacterium]
MTTTDVPASMPAVVYRGSGEVAVEDRPVPPPGPGEVLVEVDRCGICGSDLHLIAERLGAAGTVLGHEYSGVVAALGEGVTAWSVGDEVVGGPAPRCGRCRRCLEGRPSQCEARGQVMSEGHDGAFARYTLVDARALVRIPGGLGRREAALAEPLAVALHGITRSGLGPADTVMVMGAGPIGALTVAALLARDRGPVTVVEPTPPRQALARALGAEVLHPDDLPTYPMWEPERLSPLAVDVVLECSGNQAAMQAGLHQLRRGGRMVLVGAGMRPPSFDPNRMILNELTVTGSFVYDADGFDRALELLSTPGAIPADVLIEADDVGLDGVGEAVRGLAAGETAGKVMVAPGLAVAAGPTTEEA